MNSETRACQNCKEDFQIDPEDFSFYEKMQVPLPTFCSTCRMIRRFNYRNEGLLFKRQDPSSGKEIFSGFSPEAQVVTYENNNWFGGDWDPFVNAREYDFNTPFFLQFRNLLSKAPIPARSVYNMVSSDYCNEASECKNSYLCFNADFVENSAYLRKVRMVKDSFDCYEVEENELCYENVLVDKSYQTFFSLDCDSCVDVWFSKNLRGCTNCFGCVNLRNKSYYFFNEPCSKEEYAEKIKPYMQGSYSALVEIQKKAREFWLQFPNKFYHGTRVVASTGERLFDTKNVKNSYYVKDAENVRYCQDLWAKTSESYDYSVWGDGAQNIYESMTCGMGIYNIKFSFNCWEQARDLEYCGYCIGSKNCFGCVGLYKKEYCILNKQYTKEEYFSMVDTIKKHMHEMPYKDSKGRIYAYGEFFPQEVSPIAYNESLAHDFFPLQMEAANERGYTWREPNVREYETTMSASNLPDMLADAGENITKEVLECLSCRRAYRIIPIELQFYTRMNIPLPRHCYNCRFLERFKLVNKPLLWERTCMCGSVSHAHTGACQNIFETSYAPTSPDIVYCESCYQQDVV